MVDVTTLTLAEAAAAFRAGRLSPVELTQAYLDRIARHDSTLNSYITVTGETALAEAQAAADELARGIDRGPLQGIPIAYKDLIHTKGVRTTSGSRILADRVSDRDATVVTALSKAGAVSLGKLNMLECAYGVVHDDYGPALNPWDLEHSSGGSSSGSGVAVAAGLCLASLGTDTGGSIRCPASWCGIVGHKPTYGLVSRAGLDPLSWTLDHVGPMTRTVQDAALLLEAIAGYDPADPGSAPAARFRAADLDEVNPTTLRVGVPRELLDIGVDGEIRRAVEAAIEQLAGLGMRVTEVVLPNVEELVAAEFVIISAEASAIHQPWLRTRPEDYSPLTRDRLEAGCAIPAVHYLNAQQARRTMAEAVWRLHEQVDLLALPAMPVAAPRQDQERLLIDGVETDDFRTLIRITGPFNVLGAPAVSVPAGWTQTGLPIGLQLTGRPFEDHVVLAAARAFETARGEALRLPEAVA